MDRANSGGVDQRRVFTIWARWCIWTSPLQNWRRSHGDWFWLGSRERSTLAVTTWGDWPQSARSNCRFASCCVVARSAIDDDSYQAERKKPLYHVVISSRRFISFSQWAVEQIKDRLSSQDPFTSWKHHFPVLKGYKSASVLSVLGKTIPQVCFRARNHRMMWLYWSTFLHSFLPWQLFSFVKFINVSSFIAFLCIFYS